MKVQEAIAVMMVLLAWAPLASAQANAPLKLEQTIPLPDIQGRIDHLSLDVAAKRLLVSALGNDTPRSRGSAEDSADARRLS